MKRAAFFVLGTKFILEKQSLEKNRKRGRGASADRVDFFGPRPEAKRKPDEASRKQRPLPKLLQPLLHKLPTQQQFCLFFLQRSEAALAESAARDGAASLLMLDIDRFKRINDEHGHAAGDTALVAIARQLAAVLRPQDLFGRMGGEEFAILLPDISPEDARGVAERVRAACDQLELTLDDGRTIKVTTSINTGHNIR